MHSIIYASKRLSWGIEELPILVSQIATVYGQEFVSKSDNDEAVVHEDILNNINPKEPEDWVKADKIIEIAQKEGAAYTPSEKINTVEFTK